MSKVAAQRLDGLMMMIDWANVRIFHSQVSSLLLLLLLLPPPALSLTQSHGLPLLARLPHHHQLPLMPKHHLANPTSPVAPPPPPPPPPPSPPSSPPSPAPPPILHAAPHYKHEFDVSVVQNICRSFNFYWKILTQSQDLRISLRIIQPDRLMVVVDKRSVFRCQRIITSLIAWQTPTLEMFIITRRARLTTPPRDNTLSSFLTVVLRYCLRKYIFQTF